MQNIIIFCKSSSPLTITLWEVFKEIYNIVVLICLHKQWFSVCFEQKLSSLADHVRPRLFERMQISFKWLLNGIPFENVKPLKHVFFGNEMM